MWNIDKFFYQNLKRKMVETWTWMLGNKIYFYGSSSPVRSAV